MMKNLFRNLMLFTTSALSLAVNAGSATTGDYVHYSFPIAAVATIENANQPTLESSKTLWRQVSGKQLKQGVALYNHGAQPLVLLSHHSKSSSTDVIDVKQLILKDKQGIAVKSQMVSEQALRETGFFSRSAAVMTEDKAARGPLTLQSNQPFADEQLFVMTVKDKYSPVSLDVFAPHQQVKTTQPHLAKVSMKLFARQKLSLNKHAASVEAILHAPDGERIQLEVAQGPQEMTILPPKINQPLPPRQGLYDIEVKLNATYGGHILQRNVKVAVAIPTMTASLTRYTMLPDQPAAANITLLAREPARYEVRAVLYGYNRAGKQVAIMEGHAAQMLNSGERDIIIPFDLSKLGEQTFVGPYAVGNVRLYDQDQLALLDESAKRTITKRPLSLR
ncbi:DUF4785 domain-containing protein [Alteromonas ponticola]|uniref:DUF4785 family protein n=1 Tax=Alteromonas ponticola TaxID=2720613 RepID=A0ABX1R6Y4_9ALTE|nr:DUF4785 domain-containing protein [Alteromonas ponticola]NMH60988.1 DUF4785 family protein [Alteromonas ponticola]